MMREYTLLLGLVILIFASSCDKQEEIKKENVIVAESEFTFDKTQEELEARIELVNQDVLFSNKSTSEVLDYKWIANILPITAGGTTLSASSVDGFDNTVYVGWHARGENVVGELSVVSVEDPNLPIMTQYGPFPFQEVNDIEAKKNEGKLLVAGQATKDMSGAAIGDKNAYAQAWNLNPTTGYVTNMAWEKYLKGYSANSVTYVTNQTVWVSKGSKGGLTVFRDYDTDDIKLDMNISNAKHFDATGYYGVLLYGTGNNESVIRVWNMENLYTDFEEFTIPYDVTKLGKNSVDVNYNFAYLAMGNDGVVKVDLNTGEVVNRFDYNNGGNANGVYVDWEDVYVAYGADGLFILDKETFDVVGNWDYDGSCNYVKKIGDYLYLANGDIDGMIILKKN